ncbi:MAG TPA: hypothetical protein VNI01_10425, partial [Elusimicrobiota bacterium]|nr:hypothetical protein [Elusimicrobiota bacterium]
MTAFLKKALSAALAASLCLPASAANTVSRPASVPAQAFQALVQTAPAGTPFAAALGATELSASDYLSPIRAADPALDQVLSARPEAAENVALWIQGMSALEREHAPASEPIPGRVASGAPERRPAGADTDEKGGAEKPSWRGLTRTQMWKAVVSAVGGLDRASLKSEAGLLGAGEKLGALMDLAAARPELGAAASPVALGASDAHPNVARGLRSTDDGIPRIATPEDFHELARGRFDRHSRSPELEETGRWRGYDEDGNFIEESLRPDGGSSYYYVSRAGARTLLLETTGARTSALDHGAVAALPELPPAPGYSYSDGVKNLFNGVFRMRGDTTEVRWVFLWDPVTGDFEHQPYEFVIPGHMKPRNNFYTGPLPRGLQYQKWGGRAEFVLGNGGVTLYFDAGGNMGPFPPALEKRFLDSFARTYHFPVHAVRIAGRAALERAGDPRAGAVKAATEEFERSFGVLPEWVRQSLEGRTLGSLRADAKDADAARIHRSVLAEFYLGRVIDEVVGGDPVLLGVSRNYPEVFIGAARSLLSLALAGFDGSLDFSGGGLAGRATWVRAWAREASPVIAASKGGAGLTLSFGLLSAYLREPALPPLTGRAMAHSVGLPDVASAVETLKIAGRWLAGGWQSEARFADQAVAALRAYAAIPGLATPELLQARIGEERAREQAVRVGALRVSGPARAYRRALRRMPVGERENFGAWLERAAAERGLRAAAAESGMEAGELLLHWVEADLSRLPAAWLAPGRLGWRAAAIRVLSWLGLRRLALRLFGAVSDEGLLRALALGGAPELLADARGLEPEEARAFAARAPWLGSTARKTTASAAPAARRESIGRWNPDWPKPTEAELAYAEAFLSRAAQAELAGDAFAREFRDRLHLKISSARALRAIFYLSPEWAATLAASFRSGNHGVWRDSMDLFRERGQEGKVEIGMVAALFELGLNAANAGARPEWKGVRYAGGYELEGLVGSYGQVSEEGRTHLYADLSSRLSDRALAELLSRAFEFRTRREKHRTRASVILEGLLLPLGARVRQLMPTLSRDLQRAISPSDDGQAAAPAAAAEPVFGAPRVAVPTARVSGKGVGRLVIVRGEPTLAQLMAIPAGSIVALEYLPKSDVRIGPFAGIITYRDEGETSHAQALARDIWGVPHALLPGPEAIADLEGQRVALKVPEGGGDPAIGGVGPDEP